MDDLISRQAALECCRNEWEEEVEERLKSLPPVNPQPKTGKWMETDSADPYWYMCSECHRRLSEQEAYCPSCGAKMK